MKKDYKITVCVDKEMKDEIINIADSYRWTLSMTAYEILRYFLKVYNVGEHQIDLRHNLLTNQINKDS